MLWRIKDCEELLKNRVSAQELNDQIKALENRIRAKNHEENEAHTERLKKSFEHSEMRIKMNENLFMDKFNIVREQIEVVQSNTAGMATKETIDKINENEKLIKSNF